MFKIKLIAAAISALVVSTNVLAVADVPAGLGGNVDTTMCPVLQSTVMTGLTQKVAGAYVCRLADAVTGTLNRVGVGTCHPGGSAKSRLVTCSRSSSGDVTAPTYTYAPTTCGSGNFDSSGVALTGTAGQGEITGISMFGGSTNGGAISQTGMATSNCDSTGISSLVGTTFQ